MTAVNRSVTCMESYTGKYVDLLNPQPSQICLTDIAVGLANTPRFGGQTSRWYSVAEHSVRCAEEADGDWRLTLACLLHDAHEAYTGDITAPMKRVLGPELKELQDRLDAAIAVALKFPLEWLDDPRVKAVDDRLLLREAAGLKYSHGIGEHWGNHSYHAPMADFGWSPAKATRRFIGTYRRFINGS